MIVLGVDAHKRTHTVVAADPSGTQVATLTVAATGEGHLRLLRWAGQFGLRRWAVEDCRGLSRRLEADLLGAGERVVRVPPRLMAEARRGVRSLGKSDPIDALAVARVALREPDLPSACLDGDSRLLRLLVDQRETLIAERTRAQNRLRWRLHELEAGWDPSTSALHSPTILIKLQSRLEDYQGIVADLARQEVARILELTRQAHQLEGTITEQVTRLAPTLLRLPGCGALTAAKLVGETAGVSRFATADKFAMWAGAAPIPVWSANTQRHRLNRGGNRQANAALHRIAITQLRWHPPAQTYLNKRIAAGNTKTEALRSLKRHLANTVYHHLQADTTPASQPQPHAA
jgi:transposase